MKKKTTWKEVDLSAWIPKSVTPDSPQTSKVFILAEALDKLHGYINLAKGEISGFGYVEPHGERDFLITDVFILPQKTNGGHTALDEDALFDMMIQADEEGLDTSRLRLWWHSHPTFDAFWSGEDNGTADHAFANTDWMLSIVGNRDGEYLVRVDIFKPIRLTADGLELQVLRVQDPAKIAELQAEIDEKVEYAVPSAITKTVQAVGVLIAQNPPVEV